MNVKISNCLSDYDKKLSNDTQSEKGLSDFSTNKLSSFVSDKANWDSSSLDDSVTLNSDTKGNAKNIQKPQLKKRVDKSKNKQIGKENISTDAVTDILSTNSI